MTWLIAFFEYILHQNLEYLVLDDFKQDMGHLWASPGGASGKEPATNVKFDPWARKIPWEEGSNPLRMPEESMDRGAL